MPRLAGLVEQFKRHGYKMTPQRRAIIEVITGCTSQHPTAEMIHERVAERMPDISLATVYNTLRELVTVGQVHELRLGLGTRHYELSSDEHAHLVCLKCGMVKDVPGDLTKLVEMFPHNDGFRAVRHDITISGYCASCSESAAEQPRAR